MSITREEAIEELERLLRHWDLIDEGIYDLSEHDKDAVEFAISALRGPTRDMVERMRSRWIPLNKTQEHFCESCGVAFNLYAYCKNDYQFCPACGAPMTDEAVEMVMERMEVLRNES